MMKRSFIIYCVLISGLISCAKQNVIIRSSDNCRTVTLNADCSAAGSKVMLESGKKTVWNGGDSVSVFYGGSTINKKAFYSGQPGAQSGPITFTDTAGIASGRTLAVVPYRKDNSLSDGILHTCIPSDQHYFKDSYDPAATLLYASSADDNLCFRYACSVVYVEIKPNGNLPVGIKSITLSSAAGEKIAGDISVNMKNPDKPEMSVEDTGSDSVTMSSESSSELCTIPAGEGRKFYFSVAQVSLSEGYSFDIELSDETHVISRNTSAKSFKGGTLSGIQCSISQMMSIIIDFNETVFTPAIPTSRTKTTSDGKNYSFTNPADGKTYSICAYSDVENAKGHWRVNADGFKCLRFDDPGSSLKLPSIKGMKLTRFGAMIRQAYEKPMLVSSEKSGLGDVVPPVSYKPATMVYSVAKGQKDSPLYLYMSSNNTQISRIELYFE